MTHLASLKTILPKAGTEVVGKSNVRFLTIYLYQQEEHQLDIHTKNLQLSTIRSMSMRKQTANASNANSSKSKNKSHLKLQPTVTAMGRSRYCHLVNPANM